MSDGSRRRVLLVLAGAADAPGGGPTDSTPLADAETPGLDSMSRRGRAGTADLGATTPWNGFAALLGLPDGAAALGPCEALGAGIDVPAGSAAWRADFVTVDDRGLRDPAAGRVSEPEAELLLEAARAALPGVTLHRLEGHRNLAVAAEPAEFAPSPWEMVGKRPLAGLPEGGRLRAWYAAAVAALAPHDVNAVRLDLLENPANALWFHGGGLPVSPVGAIATTALGGTSAGARPILVGRGRVTAGLAKSLGWEASVVDGDDEALAVETLARIRGGGLVVVRTESVLRATAHGAAAKRDALSAVDARLVRPILSALEESDAFTFVVAADSVLDAATGSLVRRPVPIAVLQSGDAGVGGRFTEVACEKSGFRCGSGADVATLLAG